MLNKLIVLMFALTWTQATSAQGVTDLLNEYLLVNSQLRSHYQKIGVGQVVAQVNTRQLAKFDEVITEKYRESSSRSSQSGMTFGFNSASSSTNYSHSSGYDSSKIIPTNPEAVANFSANERRDFGKVQQQLQSYLNKNENTIVQMLLLGTRASYLAYQLELQGLNLREEDVTDTVEMVSNVYFLGVQNVSRCVQINYAGSKDYSQTTTGSSFSANAGWWAHFASSSSYTHSASLEHVSHSITTCDASQNWARIDTSRSMQTVSVQFLSSLMREWVGALSRHRVINKQVPTFNLTWNSPFFK